MSERCYLDRNNKADFDDELVADEQIPKSDSLKPLLSYYYLYDSDRQTGLRVCLFSMFYRFFKKTLHDQK